MRKIVDCYIQPRDSQVRPAQERGIHPPWNPWKSRVTQKIVQQMVTDPKKPACHQSTPTFSERKHMYTRLVCETTAKFGFSPAKLRISTAKFWIFKCGPLQDHAPQLGFLILSVLLQNVSNLSQAVWPKSTIGMRPAHRVQLSHNLVLENRHDLAEPCRIPLVSPKHGSWQQGARNRKTMNQRSTLQQSWQPFRTTMGFDIMLFILSEGPYSCFEWLNHCRLSPWRWQSSVGNSKVPQTLRFFLCPYLDCQGAPF